MRGGLQPHRKGSLTRHSSPALAAMLRGKRFDGGNPTPSHSFQQAAQQLARGSRPGRQARPSRKSR